MEQDELNTHESMLPLMRLLDHMDHNKINPVVPKVRSQKKEFTAIVPQLTMT